MRLPCRVVRNMDAPPPEFLCMICGNGGTHALDPIVDCPYRAAEAEPSSATPFESLEEKFNTVGAFWHDAYAKWEVVIDPQHRVFEDCRYVGWGETLTEAAQAAYLQAVMRRTAAAGEERTPDA